MHHSKDIRLQAGGLPLNIFLAAATKQVVMLAIGLSMGREGRMRVIIIALAMALSAGVASAQDDVPPLIRAGLSGVGATTCSQVIANYRKKQPKQEKAVFGAVYLAWAQGFISGINRGNDALNKPVKNVEAWPPDVQTEHLMTFCDKNSSKLFVTAVFDLFYALPEFTEQK